MEMDILQQIYKKLSEYEKRISDLEQLVVALVKKLPIRNDNNFTYEKYLQQEKNKTPYNNYFYVNKDGQVVGWDNETNREVLATSLNKG